MNNSGYIIILTDKETYRTGELVKGTVFCDLFQPTKQQDIFIQFKGEQRVPPSFGSYVDGRFHVDGLDNDDEEREPLMEGKDIVMPME